MMGNMVFLYVLVFLAGLWFMTRSFRFFRRDEFSWDVKPKAGESSKTPKQLFRFTNDYESDKYKISMPYKRDAVEVFRKKQKQFAFQVDPAFLHSKDMSGFARAAKMAGMIAWAAHPNILLKIIRTIIEFVWQFGIWMFYLIVIGIFLMPVFDSRSLDGEAIGFYGDLLALILVGHIVYLLKETIVYIWQNLYSLRLLSAFGIPEEEISSVKRYLWKSFTFYIIVSIVKLPVILIVIAILNDAGI